MSDHAFFMMPEFVVIVAACVGSVIGRNMFFGGWAKHRTHSCGWFERSGYNLPGSNEPCPRCAKTDDKWKWRIGRPIPFLPIGWEWKDD